MKVKQLIDALTRLHAPDARVMLTTPGPGPGTLLVFDAKEGKPKIEFKSQVAWVHLEPRK